MPRSHSHQPRRGVRDGRARDDINQENGGMANTRGAVRRAIVKNIDIQILDPHNWTGPHGGNASLSSFMCRPGSMESDFH